MVRLVDHLLDQLALHRMTRKPTDVEGCRVVIVVMHPVSHSKVGHFHS